MLLRQSREPEEQGKTDPRDEEKDAKFVFFGLFGFVEEIEDEDMMIVQMKHIRYLMRWLGSQM